MRCCFSVFPILACFKFCESAKSPAIVRRDSEGSQQSMVVSANGAPSRGVQEDVGAVESDFLEDRGEVVSADFNRASGNATVAANRSGYSTSSSYCYEKNQASNFTGDKCWEKKPPGNTPECTASSGSTVCKCPANTDVECDIDLLSSSTPTTGRCANKTIYFYDGEAHQQNGETDVTGTKEETFCWNMVNNDQWKNKGLTPQASDGPASKNPGYWGWCSSGYTHRSGKCERKVRFLGESCWESWLGGTCKGSETSYDEYSTSCYQGTCVPYAFAQARVECTCAWFGWNFLVACSAADNKCGGHACVLTTQNMKKYCDYATGQDWNTLFR